MLVFLMAAEMCFIFSVNYAKGLTTYINNYVPEAKREYFEFDLIIRN